MSSLGESKIVDILNKEHIKFEREYIFNDLRHGAYRFDFYLPRRKIAIEFQGQQHYIFTPHFHKTKTDFKKSQERDRRKISYCLAHNIKLYCIPYWELDNIDTYTDLTHPRFLAKTKFHNDIAYRNFSSD